MKISQVSMLILELKIEFLPANLAQFTGPFGWMYGIPTILSQIKFHACLYKSISLYQQDGLVLLPSDPFKKSRN